MAEQISATTEQTTSLQWWEGIKHEPGLLVGWLKKQYHGEMTAVSRINDFAANYAVGGTPEHYKTLKKIAGQEALHAKWVGGLLLARGVQPELLDKPERYWDETASGVEDFHTGAAVASHAERMRLERIRAITADEEAPADIRDVFARILPQEEFHERAFGEMAGGEAMAATLQMHQIGRQAIGLVPID